MNLGDTQQRGRWLPIAILAAIAVVMFLLDSTGNMDRAFAFLRDPMNGLLSFTSEQTDKIADALRGPRDLQAAQQEIEALTTQIELLTREIEELRVVEGEYERLLELFDQSRAAPEMTRQVAKVIARDTSPTFRSIIIDKGSDDGVFVGMPVESARGLVGQVYRTANRTAQVVLISDNTSSVPARLANSRATGVLHGGGVGGLMTLDWINLEAVIQPGETVLTSGLVGNSPTGTVVNRFPPDIVIGRVVEVRRSEAELFQQAVVQPATNIDALEMVFVIQNFTPVDTSIFDSPGG